MIKLSSIGFTLEHDKGKIEFSYEVPYETPTVFVSRNTKRNRHAYGEAKDALKGFLKTSEGKKIVLLLEELDFIARFQPVFSKLEECNAEEVRKQIMKEWE